MHVPVSKSQLSSRLSQEIPRNVSGTPEKHPEYYMPDGKLNVVIRVQDTLFKIDLSILHQRSPVLRSIMPPVHEGHTRLVGYNDEHPFVLPGVEATDFTRLLWILYPSDSETCRATTIDDWLSILDLSTKYQIDDVRNLATARLHALPFDPIRRILIWKKYYLPKHLLACSYMELCQRSEPLSLGETRLLGLEMFTLVAAARDIFHRCTGCGCRRRSSREKQAVAEEVVKNVFFKSTVLQQRSR